MQRCPTDATDDAWFLKDLGGRVNLTEIDASPLLRKPSGNHHSGNDPLDLNTAAGLRNYSIQTTGSMPPRIQWLEIE